jgi:hypothetical protein
MTALNPSTPSAVLHAAYPVNMEGMCSWKCVYIMKFCVIKPLFFHNDSLKWRCTPIVLYCGILLHFSHSCWLVTVSHATLCSIKCINFKSLKAHHYMFQPMWSSSNTHTQNCEDYLLPSEMLWDYQSINLLLNYLIRLCPLNPRFLGHRLIQVHLKLLPTVIYTLLKFLLILLLLLILFNTPPPTQQLVSGWGV